MKSKYTIAELSQRKAAKVAGFMFLFVLLTYIFSDSILSDLIVSGNVTATANSIKASAGLFRIGMAVHLICSTSIIVLALALYIVLKPVNKNLAILGLLWRSGEAILGGIIALNDFFILSLLNGADYFTVFETSQLHALVRLFLNAHYNIIIIAIIFSTMGATIFNYLLFKSKYIPQILAAWGIFASTLALIVAFATILLPEYAALIQWGYLPIFSYEVLLALWFLIKGINVPLNDQENIDTVTT